MKILITGGNGYIARSLARSLKNQNEITSVTRNDFDLVDSRAVNNWFDNQVYDVVIHTAISGGSRLMKDADDVVDINLRMLYNLLSNKNRFGKLITFGSGAEIYSPNTPYGLSKKLISNTIRRTDNWYNLRIFGVFDENELETRFIKSSISRYIKNETIVVHENKIMDFFYMQDLSSLVEYYIKEDSLPKEIDCSYSEKFTLMQIASMINELSEKKVSIRLENHKNFSSYCGSPLEIPIKLVGLKQGIINTYNKCSQVRNLIKEY